MSLKDAEMHVFSFFGASLLTAAFFVPILFLAESRVAEGPQLEDKLVIEASIAYRKTPQKQPQKKTAPPPVEKPEGVSRDENKKPVEEKKEDKKPEAKPDDKNPFGKFARPSDDTGPATKPDEGDFNGDEKGYAANTIGDPYFGRLRGDLQFEFPEIAKASSIPVGCIRLEPDGRISDTTFDKPNGQKGDDDLQTAAEAAIARVKKARNANPESVPTHLLKYTKRYLCFSFSVSMQ